MKTIKYRAGTLLGRPRRERFLRYVPRGAVAAEVGVFRGHFTRHILTTAQPRELHLIDAWWKLYGDYFPDWGAYTRFGKLSTHDAYEEAIAIAKRYAGNTRWSVHIGDDRAVLDDFPNQYFDWVYLDSSHEYDHTRDELEILKRKVKPGGLIAGDDWIEDPKHPHHGVRQAVTEFCRRHDWRLEGLDDFGQWRISGPDR